MSGSRMIGQLLARLLRLCTWPLGRRKRAKAQYAASLFLKSSPQNFGQGIERLSIVGDLHSFNEPDTIEWLEQLPEEPIVLWDIGANIGLYSLFAAQTRKCRVIAFEPHAATFDLLNLNIALNRLEGRITALPVALCGQTRIDQFNMAAMDAGSSMHGFGVEIDQFGQTIKTVFRSRAIGMTVDDFVRVFRPPLPHYVKIDVDGLEPEIIRGGRETLSHVRSVIMEVEGSEARCSKLVKMMVDLGFVVRPKQSVKNRNVVFERPTSIDHGSPNS